MCPRPRKASDLDIYAATQRVMSRVAPGELTLAAIAAEAGVTAGALVQRFGSKRDLLLRLLEAWSGQADEMFQQFRWARASPLAALYAYADCMAQMGRSPAELAHHLGYLQMDLTDPDFHRHVKKHAVATRAGYCRLLEDAVRAGELVAGVDTVALGRQVELTLMGSLWTWAFYQEGTAAAWMRDDLDALLRPWRVPARKSGKRVARSAAGGRAAKSIKAARIGKAERKPRARRSR
jgi:AcrR family transcriptional regulator